MGKKDRAEKVFVGCRDVFAELINGLIYEGKRIVREENLLPGPTESFYRGERDEIRNQFRDCSMYEMAEDRVHTLYNLENQSMTDERMPLRCAGYDGAAYRKQYKESNEKGVYPVVSLVLNWGERPWNGAKSIRELVEASEMKIAEELEKYLDKNQIYVYDMRFLNSEIRERFQGDVRIVLDYLSDRESLINRKQKMKNPEEVMRMLYALSKDRRYLESIEFMEEGEEKSLCDLLDEAENRGIAKGRNEGRAEGRAEGRIQGRVEGEEQGIVKACKAFGIDFDGSVKKLKELLGLREEDAVRSARLYW